MNILQYSLNMLIKIYKEQDEFIIHLVKSLDFFVEYDIILS